MEGVEEAVRGVDRGDFLAIAALYKLVVDEQTDWLGVLLAIGGSEVEKEV